MPIAPWIWRAQWTTSNRRFLRSKRLPRELMAFEIEAFFTFTRAERQLIEDRRRTELKFADSRSPVVIAVTQQIKAQG
jgi:hypothetical protein